MMLLAWMLRAGAALVVFIAVDYALGRAEAAWDRRCADRKARAEADDFEAHRQAVVAVTRKPCPRWCDSVRLLGEDDPDECTCDEPCSKSYCMRRQVAQERGLA